MFTQSFIVKPYHLSLYFNCPIVRPVRTYVTTTTCSPLVSWVQQYVQFRNVRPSLRLSVWLSSVKESLLCSYYGAALILTVFSDRQLCRTVSAAPLAFKPDREPSWTTSRIKNSLGGSPVALVCQAQRGWPSTQHFLLMVEGLGLLIGKHATGTSGIRICR